MTEAQQNFIQAIEDDLGRSNPYERVGLEAGEEVTEALVKGLTTQTIEGIHQCLPEGEARTLLVQRVQLAADLALLKLKTQEPSRPDPVPARSPDVHEEAVPDFFEDSFEELRRTPSPRSRRQVTGDNAVGAIVGLIIGALIGIIGGAIALDFIQTYFLPYLVPAPFMWLSLFLGAGCGYVGGSRLHFGKRR